MSKLSKTVKGRPEYRENIREFWEYESVKRHTADEDRLRRLHDIRIDHEIADEFVIAACKRFGLTLPTMSYTGYTDRGWYYPEKHEGNWPYFRTTSHVIVVRAYHLSVFILCHEFAHHWVNLRCEKADGPHGWDFTMRLDKMAAFAEVWFRTGEV